MCARSQDLSLSVSVRRVHVIFSTARFKGVGKPCPKTREFIYRSDNRVKIIVRWINMLCAASRRNRSIFEWNRESQINMSEF